VAIATVGIGVDRGAVDGVEIAKVAVEGAGNKMIGIIERIGDRGVCNKTLEFGWIFFGKNLF
jgi:hypothetical protein